MCKGCKKCFTLHHLLRLQLINVVVAVSSDPGDLPKSCGRKSGGAVCRSRWKSVVLLPSTPILDCIRAKALLWAETSWPSASGKEQGQCHASTAPGLPESKGSTRDNQHRQPWAGRAPADPSQHWKGKNASLFSHSWDRRLVGLDNHHYSAFDTYQIAEPRTPLGLTWALIQKIPSQQDSFQPGPQQFPWLLLSPVWYKVYEYWFGMWGKGREEEGTLDVDSIRKSDMALQSSGTPFFSHKERKLMTPQV